MTSNLSYEATDAKYQTSQKSRLQNLLTKSFHSVNERKINIFDKSRLSDQKSHKSNDGFSNKSLTMNPKHSPAGNTLYRLLQDIKNNDQTPKQTKNTHTRQMSAP